MATAIAYLTQSKNGGLTGTLDLMNFRTGIEMVPVAKKKNTSQPDYRIVAGEGRTEIGAGWNRVGKTSGKPFISCTLAHPALGPNRLFANSGPANDKPEGTQALFWNPQ